jgi:hypothetical protein
MTIITFGGDESWTSPRWAFARLARATSLFMSEAADLDVLEGAVARDALSFSALDSRRACRMARALRQGACWLREDLVAHEFEDDLEETLAESLLPLAAQLKRLLDAYAAAGS